MCRNIKPLFNFYPTATDNEVREASLQFIRKVSGFNKPSEANQLIFDKAVDEIASSIQNLLDLMVTKSKPRNRENEAQLARIKAIKRFGTVKL